MGLRSHQSSFSLTEHIGRRGRQNLMRLQAFIRHPFNSENRKSRRRRQEHDLRFALPGIEAYGDWLKASEPGASQLAEQREAALTLPIQPTFSIIVPLFRTPMPLFKDLIRSVASQTYGKWELCLVLVDTGSDADLLKKKSAILARADRRIKIEILTENLGISGNSNKGLDAATGEWTVLLDHDDALSPEALYQFAAALNKAPDTAFIYSDRDMIDMNCERSDPLLKPGWSPDIMLTANYLTHLNAMPTSRLRQIGGWDAETDGAQDWDLFLRAIGGSKHVVHVPKVLYHWRRTPTSVSMRGFKAKPYAAEGQIRAVNKYLETTAWKGARAYFDEDRNIRIKWREDFTPDVCVVSVGMRKPSSALNFSTKYRAVATSEGDLAANIDAAVSASAASVIVILEGACVPQTAEALFELVSPLSNPEIAMVAGCACDNWDRIVDYGTFFRDGVAYPAFRGLYLRSPGMSGRAGWYRNASAAPASALAFRKALWSELGGFAAFKSSVRPDLSFCLAANQASAGRIFLNPHAAFRIGNDVCAFERAAAAHLSSDAMGDVLPGGDPYLHPALQCRSRYLQNGQER